VTIALLSFVAEASSHQSGKTNRKTLQLRGRIIVHRTQDNFEVASFVENRSFFLFQTSADTRRLVQIYYPHFGASTLKFSPTITTLDVRRTPICDTTLASFKASAPDIPLIDEETQKTTGNMPGLVWRGDSPSLRPSTKIPCYTLIPVASNDESVLSQPPAQKSANDTHP
jgi:hypothetical protein